MTITITIRSLSEEELKLLDHQDERPRFTEFTALPMDVRPATNAPFRDNSMETSRMRKPLCGE